MCSLRYTVEDLRFIYWSQELTAKGWWWWCGGGGRRILLEPEDMNPQQMCFPVTNVEDVAQVEFMYAR